MPIPQNKEVEQAILGCCLIDNTYEKISSLIKEEDFYFEDHQTIWQSFVELLDEGVVIDIINLSEKQGSSGVIFYGSTSAAMYEAKDILNENNIEVDLMRIRSFPFNLDVWEFIENHDLVYVIEQNRDSQMRTLIMAEGGISAEKLRSLVWFNGDPIQAKFIAKKIYERESQQALIT